MSTFVKKMKDQRGVTLIELLAVIVILGIIAAIAVPAVMNNFQTAKVNSDIQTEAIIKEAVQRFLLDVGTKTDLSTFQVTSTTDLKDIGYPSNNPTVKLSDYLTFEGTSKNIKTAVDPSKSFSVVITNGVPTVTNPNTP